MNKKGIIDCGSDWTIIFLVNLSIIILITLIFTVVVAITRANNEKTEIIVDCYDREGNLINGVNCTKEVFYCNKLENFMFKNCILEGEEKNLICLEKGEPKNEK